MEKLINIQTELKAPKSQLNRFSNYRYRSAEDILEAVKPLLKKEGCYLNLTDEVVQIGDRYYVKATVSLVSGEKTVSSTAYAREAQVKKGMDESQITGMASSYARKYALNGLFCIDDTRDADTMDNTAPALDKLEEEAIASIAPALDKLEEKVIASVKAAKTHKDLETIWSEYEGINTGKLKMALAKKSKELTKKEKENKQKEENNENQPGSLL